MTLAALGLILIAAGCHASWNLLAKRAHGGVVFVWAFGVCAICLYAPVILIYSLWQPVSISAAGWLCIAASSAIHMGYYLSLQRGYSFGDLTLVYPLARGVGPLLAMILAIVILGERPGGVALFGGLLVVIGIFFISGGLGGLRSPRDQARKAMGYGLLTACFICTYTLVDKQAVFAFLVPPLVYEWLAGVGRVLLLSPLVWRRRDRIREVLESQKGRVLGIAVLSPLGYILVLTAMTFTPVSYVAPAREISILLGTVLGARVLGEAVGAGRWLAAALMCLGVMCLALG